jgi:putative membrane protein insertion efficiency factor
MRRVVTTLLVLLVSAYRVGLAPHLGPCCRYEPSCSAYALEALRVHGPWRGVGLAARRVLRCHPFRAGGYDPVPDPLPPSGPPTRSDSFPWGIGGSVGP